MFYSNSGAPLPENVSVPAEYVTFVLCRQLHCLPSQLKAENYRDVAMMLRIMAVENDIEKQKGMALDPSTRSSKQEVEEQRGDTTD